jgi:hypothetical protein
VILKVAHSQEIVNFWYVDKCLKAVLKLFMKCLFRQRQDFITLLCVDEFGNEIRKIEIVSGLNSEYHLPENLL